jgi:ATP-dependent helicase HrpA
MLMCANELGCLREILIITSALSIQDPRERPAEKRQASDEKHRRFWDDASDFVAYLNLWEYAEKQRQDLTKNQWSKLCKQEYLSFLRMREWRELHHQIRVACKKIGLKENNVPAGHSDIHKSLLSGLLGNIGLKSEEEGEPFYLGARNRRFSIFPGSSQFKKRPKWIMAAELLETSKLFGHSIGKIEPEWVLELAKHIVKHHYYQPHYNVKTGQVMGFDRITLFGLVLADKCRVNYSDVDAVLAREVFIRSALVEGGYHNSRIRKKGTFFEQNKRTIEGVHTLEAKARRRDILVDDEVVFQFYNEIIPNNVVNLAGFEHWRKSVEVKQPNILIIPQQLLMHHDAEGITEAQFPDRLNIDGMSLHLSYHFEPNHADDGVSIGVPAGILHTLPEHHLDWLVPGLLRDKCIALIKSLPKQWRKLFVPVPHYVDQILLRISPNNQPLTQVLRQGHDTAVMSRA